jgi:hypothetical protein
MSAIAVFFIAPPVIIACICIIVFIVCSIINFFIAIGNIFNSVFPSDPPVPDSKYTMDKTFGYPFLDKLGLFLITAGIIAGCVTGGMYLTESLGQPMGIQANNQLPMKTTNTQLPMTNMQLPMKTTNTQLPMKTTPPSYEQVMGDQSSIQMDNQQKPPPDFNQL